MRCGPSLHGVLAGAVLAACAASAGCTGDDLSCGDQRNILGMTTEDANGDCPPREDADVEGPTEDSALEGGFEDGFTSTEDDCAIEDPGGGEDGGFEDGTMSEEASEAGDANDSDVMGDGAGPDAMPDAMPDAAPDAMPDVSSDALTDAPKSGG